MKATPLLMDIRRCRMDIDLRLESSLWVGKKRYRAVLTGWYFNWTEVDKKNREKKTSKWDIFPIFKKGVSLLP